MYRQLTQKGRSVLCLCHNHFVDVAGNVRLTEAEAAEASLDQSLSIGGLQPQSQPVATKFKKIREKLRVEVKKLKMGEPITGFEHHLYRIMWILILTLAVEFIYFLFKAPNLIVNVVVPLVFFGALSLRVYDLWSLPNYRYPISQLAEELLKSMGEDLPRGDDVKVVLEDNKDFMPKSLRMSVVESTYSTLPWTPTVLILFGLFGGLFLPLIRVGVKGSDVNFLSNIALAVGFIGFVLQIKVLAEKRDHEYRKSALRELERQLRDVEQEK